MAFIANKNRFFLTARYCFQATPIATKTIPALPQSFFARPAEVVALELVGCLLVKRQEGGELLWGVIVETEAYSQEEPACHDHRCVISGI